MIDNKLDKNKNEMNNKIDEQLKKLEELDNNAQRTVKLTVEQMKYLLSSSENGETAYHKLFQKVIETKEKLQLAVEQEHNKTTIQKYKKYIQEHMSKIEGYIDALELASRDFVDRETDIYLKNSESFEDEIIKLAIIKEEYGELEKEYNSLKSTYEDTNKELNETKAEVVILNDENENRIKIIGELKNELVEVKEKLISESRKVTELIEKDNNEIKELQSELDKEIKSRMESEQEMFEMRLKETSILNEKDSFKQRAEDLKEQNRSLNNRLERLEIDTTDKANTILKLIEEKNELDKENMKLKNNIKSMENIEKDKDKLETLLKSEREKYEEIIAEKAKLELELENQKSITAKLEKEIELLKKKNK